MKLPNNLHKQPKQPNKRDKPLKQANKDKMTTNTNNPNQPALINNPNELTFADNYTQQQHTAINRTSQRITSMPSTTPDNRTTINNNNHGTKTTIIIIKNPYVLIPQQTPCLLPFHPLLPPLFSRS